MDRLVIVYAYSLLTLITFVQEVYLATLMVALSEDLFPPNTTCWDDVAVSFECCIEGSGKYNDEENTICPPNKTQTVVYKFGHFAPLICLDDSEVIDSSGYCEMSISVNGVLIKRHDKYDLPIIVLPDEDPSECPSPRFNMVSAAGVGFAKNLPWPWRMARTWPYPGIDCAPSDQPKQLSCPTCSNCSSCPACPEYPTFPTFPPFPTFPVYTPCSACSTCPPPDNCVTSVPCSDQLALAETTLALNERGYAPVIVPGKLQTATVRAPVNMSCTVTAKPTPNIFWVFEDVRTRMTVLAPDVLEEAEWKTAFHVSSNDTIEAVLHIASTEEEDFMGVFRCFAVNDWGQASEAFVLQKFITAESHWFRATFAKGPFRKIKEYLTYEVFYVPVS